MSGKSSAEFQWTDDEIQLLLEATQNLKVEDYKKITRFYSRPTIIYVLVFLHSVVSLYKKLSLLYWTLNSKSYPIIFPDMFPLAFRSGSIAIQYASYHFQNWSVPTPLPYENHAEKNMFQWKQKVYPIWKMERSHSDPYDGNILLKIANLFLLNCAVVFNK